MEMFIEAQNRAQDIMNKLYKSNTFMNFFTLPLEYEKDDEDSLYSRRRTAFNAWVDADEDESDICPNLWFASGCTRVVIGDYNHNDYVIKLQIEMQDDNIDYNKNEYNVYRLAQESEINDLFAWNDFVPVKLPNGTETSVFVMKYYDVDEDANYDDCSDYLLDTFCEERGYDRWNLNSQERYEWECSYSDAGSSASMIEYICVKRHISYDTIYSFISKTYDTGNSDWHTGNWGRDDNDNLILVDYAGYHTVIIK